MIIEHICYECGFIGEVLIKDGLVKCPNCPAFNDVWLEGDSEPERYRKFMEMIV